MTAASDARERLEAAIWRLADPAATAVMMATALSAADAYAEARADEEAGALRLQLATAEYTRRAG